MNRLALYFAACCAALALSIGAFAGGDSLSFDPMRIDSPRPGDVKLASRGHTVKTTQAHAEIYSVNTTGAILTMAGSAAQLILGNTSATGVDLAESVTSRYVTTSLTAGTFTVQSPGVYELYFNGRLTGEEDEDVTLSWQLDSTDIEEPCEFIQEFDAATGVAELTQNVAQSCLVSLDNGDVIRLGALGSNSEVITFQGFNFGVRRVASEQAW